MPEYLKWANLEKQILIRIKPLNRRIILAYTRYPRKATSSYQLSQLWHHRFWRETQTKKWPSHFPSKWTMSKGELISKADVGKYPLPHITIRHTRVHWSVFGAVWNLYTKTWGVWNFILKNEGVDFFCGMRGLKFSLEKMRGLKFTPEKMRGLKTWAIFPENTPGTYSPLKMSAP